MKVLAPVSLGELLDKITILVIKMSRIRDQEKLRNVAHELQELSNVSADWYKAKPWSQQVEEQFEQLNRVNQDLWILEDAIRRVDTDTQIAALATQIIHKNDQRALIKKNINVLAGSDIVEEKSY